MVHLQTCRNAKRRGAEGEEGQLKEKGNAGQEVRVKEKGTSQTRLCLFVIALFPILWALGLKAEGWKRREVKVSGERLIQASSSILYPNILC
mmetsp:Transcript_49157/g.126891  ORF Transcript_49157/g.126891 Transcript_49157/m.126891 type:complete len:92 (+) Transcript_49157:446-721(+)